LKKAASAIKRGFVNHAFIRMAMVVPCRKAMAGIRAVAGAERSRGFPGRMDRDQNTVPGAKNFLRATTFSTAC
jgi:hypothetical protein